MDTVNNNSTTTNWTDQVAESRAAQQKKGKTPVINAQDPAAFIQTLSQVGQTPSQLTKLSGIDERYSSKGTMENPAESGGTAAAEAKAVKMDEARKALFTDSANRSPTTRTAAASVNTASAIAGLKPWGKDWVFEGAEENPNLKPLFAKPETSIAGGSSPKGSEANQGPALNSAMLEAILSGKIPARQQGIGETGKSIPGSPDSASSQALGPEATQSYLRMLRGGADGAPAYGAQAAEMPQAQMNDISQLMGNMRAEGTVQSPRTMVLSSNGSPYADVSGGDYLTMMNTVKASQGREPEGQMGQDGFSQQGGNSGFQLIEGGQGGLLKGKKLDDSEFNPALTPLVGHVTTHTANYAQPPVEVTGHVVPGAMAQNRLSSEALANVSSGVRNLAAQGGGEMHIRLKPENLGELHLKVVTRGSEVGLQIQASDQGAKRILEESMSHLKESLASQNLNLGRVQLSVAGLSGHSEFRNDSPNQQQSQQQHNGFHSGSQDLMGQNAGQNGLNREGTDRWTLGDDTLPASGSRMRSANVMGSLGSDIRSRGAAVPGRIDVRA